MANTSLLLISPNFMKFGNTSRDLNYKLQEEGKKREHQINKNKLKSDVATNDVGKMWQWKRKKDIRNKTKTHIHFEVLKRKWAPPFKSQTSWHTNEITKESPKTFIVTQQIMQ